MPEIQMTKLSAEHRLLACAPSGHLVRCSAFSGVQLRWAHRLKVRVPTR